MTTYRYTAQAMANEAKAVGVSLPVSFKQSYEVAKYLRGKSLAQAKKMLEDAIALRKPVPMTTFNTDTGHKPGMAAGRFPINTCTSILKLLKNAESNAQFKGLSASNLVVRHIAAQQGPVSWHYGRHRRRRQKRAHVEIILCEAKTVQQERTQKKTTEKPAVQKTPEQKHVAPKAEQKPALQAPTPKALSPKSPSPKSPITKSPAHEVTNA